MFEEDYKILSLFREMGKIKGRKKMHKIVYLLQHLGHDFGCEYIYCHYGPYSPQLQLKLDRMSQQGIISEEMISGTYEYSSSTRGLGMCDALEKADIVDKFQVSLDLLRVLNCKDTNLLELASTVIFVKESGYNPTGVFEKVGELKPHLMNRYTEAEEFLNQIFGENGVSLKGN